MDAEINASSAPVPQEAETVITNKIVCDVIAYINAHYLSNISLAGLADEFFLSKVFKKNCGLSPSEYRTRKRAR